LGRVHGKAGQVCPGHPAALAATAEKWLTGLKDVRSRVAIQARIDRMATGNLGDIKTLSGALYEARVFVGPGYRLYFIRQGQLLVVLLSGGDKGSQQRDIKAAQQLAAAWRANHD
jgi:putative addiction module killer protein